MNLKELADKYKDKIIKNKASYKAIASMAQVSLEDAKKIAALVRPPKTKAKEYKEDKLSINRNYVYNEDTDTYITYLPNSSKPIILSGESHRGILRAYSNFDGTPSSINEIAREFAIPRNILVKYLKAHNITHDSEPFSVEEIKSRSEEDLVEEALQITRSALFKQIEQAKWKQTQKEALAWRKFHNDLILPLESLNRVPVEVRKLDLKRQGKEFAIVLGLTDFHYGKYSDPLENGASFGKKEAEEMLFQATQEVLKRVTCMGKPEKIIIPIGSDFLHMDTDKGTTTSGTAQDLDGTPAEILTGACDLLNKWLNSLRQVAPLELVLMSGNHDRLLGISLLLYVEALFTNCKDVTVHRQRCPRTYVTYGSNLIGFAHGDGVKKTKDLVGHMARENPNDWAVSKHKTIYTGHLHFEKTDTDAVFGVTRYQIPSLSGPDRWHSLNGFEGAPRMLPAYIHDKEEGLISIVYSNRI